MTDTVPAVIPATITSTRVSIVYNNRQRSYLRDSDRGARLVELLKERPQNIEAICEIADIASFVAQRSEGRVVVDERDQLRLDGRVVDYGLAGRVTKLIDQGFDWPTLAHFVEQVDQNPNKGNAADLYRFLEKGNNPFTPDGAFLAYKRVDADLHSFHAGREKVRVYDTPDAEARVMTGRVQYPLGGVVEMDRADCDEDRSNACSRGLHVCSFDYLPQFHNGQGRILICKVRPSDVTSVPIADRDIKLRCCRVEVVGEIPEEDARDHFSSVVDRRYPSLPREYGGFDLAAWAAQGAELGAANGAKDARNGYDPDYSAPVPTELANAPAPFHSAYTEAYAEAYAKAHVETEAEPMTAERAAELGLKEGAAQAQSDYDEYDNDPTYGESYDVIWNGVVEEPLKDADDSPLVQAYVAAFKRSYHEAFGLLLQAENAPALPDADAAQDGEDPAPAE